MSSPQRDRFFLKISLFVLIMSFLYVFYGCDDEGSGDTSGWLCSTCEQSDECGGPLDLCLMNEETLEQFCGRVCDSSRPCPDGYSCTYIGGFSQESYQCAPASLTCGGSSNVCNPPCASDQVCVEGTCIGGNNCDPPCTADQVCVEGTCVDSSNCDPPCSGDQICVDGECVGGTVDCDPPCRAGQDCVDGTCVGTVECNPPCSGSQVCRDGTCVDTGTWEAELQFCVDYINSYRSQHGRSALTRSAALEGCAMAGAEEDAGTGRAHGHFSRTSGCNWTADAENEIPGWGLDRYGSVTAIIEGGTDMMMDEGPGGGHYENILGDHTAVGCGIFVTSSNAVWVIQDFR